MQEVFSKIIEKLEELHERYVNQYGVVGGNSRAFAVRECIDIVEKIVKQEAEKFGTDTNVGSNGWIPCSERLPEKEGKYLVTLDKWNIVSFADFKNLKYNPHFNAPVIAWQPLPQPYTKGE